jgi:zinc transport system substrate-binding protein
MKKIIWFSVLLLPLITCCLDEEQQELDRIGVVVTILPQAEFVEKIGGEKVQVAVMVPPGASPHTYEPTPSQLQAVSTAKVYAKVGSGVEFELAWMDKIIDANKDILVVDCSQGIELIHMGGNEEGKGYDPHIWLSPKNAEIMVETIYKGLIQVDPSNQEYYEQNKNAYRKELETLDETISQALSEISTKKIMVLHPAWGYFCREYGLEQIPIEAEGKEPTPQGIIYLIEQAREYNIRIIFASPQFSTESADVIAREIGGTVVLLDPLAKSYVSTMLKAAEAFEEV